MRCLFFSSVAGCGYDDDLDQVRKVLADIVADDDRVLDEPATTIAVSSGAGARADAGNLVALLCPPVTYCYNILRYMDK